MVTLSAVRPHLAAKFFCNAKKIEANNMSNTKAGTEHKFCPSFCIPTSIYITAHSLVIVLISIGLARLHIAIVIYICLLTACPIKNALLLL